MNFKYNFPMSDTNLSAEIGQGTQNQLNQTKVESLLDIQVGNTLDSAYNKVTFNENLPITKENLSTKYTTFTYKYITLNEKPPIMKQNLHIFFFIIGRVECNKAINSKCLHQKI